METGNSESRDLDFGTEWPDLPEPWFPQPVSCWTFAFPSDDSHPKGEKVPSVIHQFPMGPWLGSFSNNFIIGEVEQNQGEKKKRRNMLYPEKEKRSSQGGSVILQDKNTNRYPIRLCQRSFKHVYGSSFQSVVPRHKTSTTPGNLLEMQNLRCPLIFWSWGLAI